jgi:ketosteroid isomerase-like protein
MSANKKILESYFANPDRAGVADLLADDFVWTEWADGVPASGVQSRGKDAHLQNYGDDVLRTEISRMTEENGVVVAEGTTRVHKKDGRILTVRFVNIFEMDSGKIRRKTSFGALVQDSA